MQKGKIFAIAGVMAVLAALSATFVFAQSPGTIPVAPTGLTAVYATTVNGPQVQLTVTDNANNETEYRLYWRLAGTAWATTFQATGPNTWSFPANTGGMQLAAPTPSGGYEYQVQACNSAGCSLSNTISVQVGVSMTIPSAPSSLRFEPAPSATTIYLQWIDNSNNEESFNVDRKFVSDGSYAGNLHWATLPANTTSFADTNVVVGQHYDYRVTACNATGCSDSINRSDVVTTSATTCTLTLDKSSYTTAENVNYTYTCSRTASSITVQVVKPDSTATTYVTGNNVSTASLGFGTSNLAPGAYTLRICINDPSCPTSSIVSSAFAVTAAASATQTLNGTIYKEGRYIDPSTLATRTCPSGSVWMKEGATASGARGFHCMPNYTQINTDLPPTTCTGTLWAGSSFSNDSCSTTVTTTGSTTPPVPPTSPNACQPGEKCAKGSWCQNGSQCFYPDGQITCVATATPTGSGMMSMPLCPAGTAYCNATDTYCVEPGQTVPSSTSKWCGGGSQKYYSKDGTTMTCVRTTDTPPAGMTACQPGGDANCRQKGDTWTGGTNSYYCTNGQKCTSSAGGSCVGWNESCPSGTLYCQTGGTNSTADAMCIEPDSYKAVPVSSSNGSPWCGGAGGMPVFGTLQGVTYAYCPVKKAGTMGGMRTAQEVLEIIAKMKSAGYSDVKLCSPNMATNCIEPGKTGPSNGWCAWMSPDNMQTTPMGMTTAPRTCPALEGGTVNPPPPPPDVCTQVVTRAYNQDTKECKDFSNSCLPSGWIAGQCTIGPKPPTGNWGKRIWTFSDGLTETSYVLSRTDKEYTDYLDSVSAQCKAIPHSKFTWRGSAGTDSPDNWKNFGIPDCSGTGGPIVVPPPMPWPVTMRECKPGEMAGPNNYCMMPQYRWNIAAKKFEKCPASDSGRPIYYTSVRDPKAAYTSCQSMVFEYEEKWRTLRYLTRPPEKYDEYYMPGWGEPGSVQKQYNPATDQFEQCDIRNIPPAYSANPGMMTYVSPCTSVNLVDQDWLLEKARAEKKMFDFYAAQYKTNKQLPQVPTPITTPTQPAEKTDIEELNPLAPKTQIIAVPQAQCKQYLNDFRFGLTDSKRFWKDFYNTLEQIKGAYADEQTARELLKNAKNNITDTEKILRIGKCDQDTVNAIQKNIDTLHTTVFSDMGSYLTDMQDQAELLQCRNKLNTLSKSLDKLLQEAKDNGNEEVQKNVEDFSAQVSEKSKEIADDESTVGFGTGAECKSFARDIELKIAPMRLQTDKKLSKIVEENIRPQAGDQINKLFSQHLEESQKMIDQLFTQIATLQTAVSTISKAAEEISSNVAVSYKAMARFDERFFGERQQAQEAKDLLIPLVKESAEIVDKTKCITSTDKDRIAQIWGGIASTNWVVGADEMKSSLDTFNNRCRANDIAKGDVESLAARVQEAKEKNLALSYSKGITPFADVTTDAWYFAGMQSGAKTGFMTKGMPAENVLRQDALLMVLRSAGMTDSELKGDCALSGGITASPYASCAVKSALVKGITLNGSLMVPASRVEIAQWIAALSNLPETGTVDDVKSYQDLAGLNVKERAAVATVVRNQVMLGNVNSTEAVFKPREPLTRGALAVILDQLLSIKEQTPAVN